MTGVILRLMQEHFAGAAQLGYTVDFDGKLGLENCIWTNDPTTTKMQIQPFYKMNLQDVQNRPALYIKRNKWSTKKIAINDGQSVSVVKDKAGQITQIRGEKHSRLVIGAHTIFAVAKSGAEAELIGAEVFDYLMSFAPILRQELGLHNFEVLDLEEIKPVKEWTDIYVVPIVVGYAKAWTWRLEEVSPFLQKFAIELRSANK